MLFFALENTSEHTKYFLKTRGRIKPLFRGWRGIELILTITMISYIYKCYFYGTSKKIFELTSIEAFRKISRNIKTNLIFA